MTTQQRHDTGTYRRWLGLSLGCGLGALGASGQIFIRETTWGLIEPPEVGFSGLVEVVSGLLLLQLSMLLFTGYLMRKKWRLARRVPSLARRLDHVTARKELRQRITKGSKLLALTTYILAPLSGLAGIILGAPFTLGPVDVALIMVLVAILILGLGGMTLSRIKRTVVLVP